MRAANLNQVLYSAVIDAGAVPGVRFVPTYGAAPRAAVLLQLTGTGVLSATVRPVFRRRLGDGSFEQYEDDSQDATVGATTSGFRVLWFDILPGLDFSLKLTAISGTNAQVLAFLVQQGSTVA